MWGPPAGQRAGHGMAGQAAGRAGRRAGLLLFCGALAQLAAIPRNAQSMDAETSVPGAHNRARSHLWAPTPPLCAACGCRWKRAPSHPVASAAAAAANTCRCKDSPLAQEFWRKMCLRGIKPIDSKEAEGSQMDAAQAAEWFTQHKLS